MKISELARRTGVSVRMLRYYEDEGFLRPERASNGYRNYTFQDERTVLRMRLLGQAGLTLASIRSLLPCVRSDTPDFIPCDRLRELLQAEVDVLDGKIGRLVESRKVLSRFLDAAE